MGAGKVTGQASPEKAVEESREADNIEPDSALANLLDRDWQTTPDGTPPENETEDSSPPSPTSSEPSSKHRELSTPAEKPPTFSDASTEDFSPENNEHSYRNVKERLIEETVGTHEAEDELIERLETGESITFEAGSEGVVADAVAETGTDPDYVSNNRRLQIQDDAQLGTPETQSFDNLEAAPDTAGSADSGWEKTGSQQNSTRIEFEEDVIEEVLASPTNPYTTNKKDVMGGLRAADNGLTTDEEIEQAARKKLSANNVELGDDTAYLRPEGTPLASFNHEIKEVEDNLEIESTPWGTVDHDGITTADEERYVNQRVTEPATIDYPTSDFSHAESDTDTDTSTLSQDSAASNDPPAGFAGTLPAMSEREATETLTKEFSDPTTALTTVTDRYDVDRSTAKKATAFAVNQHTDLDRRKETACAVAATEQAGFNERVFTYSEIKESAGGDHRQDPSLNDPKAPGKSLPNTDYWRDGKTRGNIAGEIEYIGDAKGDADTYTYISPPGSNQGDFGEQVKVTFYDQAAFVRDAKKGDSLAIEDAKIEWRFTGTETGEDGYEPVATVKSDTQTVTTLESESTSSSSPTSSSGTPQQNLTYTTENIAAGKTNTQSETSDNSFINQPSRHTGTEATTMGITTPDSTIDDARRDLARRTRTNVWIDSTGTLRSLDDHPDH